MLEIQGLHAYYGFVHALKGLNIKVGKGQVVTLLGANGAGKTSTLKCISGVLRPSQGKIVYKDKDITHESIENIVKAGIVQSPEGRQVFSTLSVKDNLMAGAFTINDTKKVQENLELAYSYFPRLKEREKQYAGTLSGGEQQMLAIARALMASPELLILDEPSLGLAPLIVKDIFRIVKEINKTGTTILLVEQNAKQALGVSDYAYVLETGKILFEGPAKQMENDENIKKAYLGA
ncbi:high-affinity branched-chain amino acid transport ATP-binding protein LivF [Clostridium homopropionicum DSM 5847]|uniref:High-affinity branched-chain amino acid transport ATP-binding protein LivF n=1 Tax=Clostridium homopropionicum DSM 5847 TaxID=1121318 RepID=A0A0L6ZBM8_9CLOT|nr:ABC transporter ATP-binding protein [Clostridium homopropionicum]KOA20376.1 high-affinity branched-chain amino acid transport ATP-binding protein LivF [Clostridium homopropionicum DSM 5847]SFG74551.1 amino acid/amide ABC transporter ATP-binding protein 2, HAAT family [Clostridium homopropionicum]